MYNNEQVSKVLGRISSETCLKMDYFRSNSQKIAKCWGLRTKTSLQWRNWRVGGGANVPWQIRCGPLFRNGLPL